MEENKNWLQYYKDMLNADLSANIPPQEKLGILRMNVIIIAVDTHLTPHEKKQLEPLIDQWEKKIRAEIAQEGS